MKDTILTTRLSNEERETYYHINYGENTVICDSTIPRDYKKCVKQNWTILERLIYDGAVVGMILQAPRKSLSIRNANGMSEEQKAISAERMRKYHESISNTGKSNNT